MDSIGERLKEERQRLDMSQTEFGELGGVLKQAQIKYEKGERFPDAAFLAAISQAGADVQYIVTGERQGHGIGESAVHQAVLDAVDLLSLEKKVDADQLARAVVKLTSKSAAVASPPPSQVIQGSMQVFHKAPTGDIAGRDIVKKGKPR